ncbi:MAG: hypothetical protein AMS21_02645 [Gemmatimonas sp. SG8_38_2]|nr:MAG: hypothetical protein AMS21_02645 [Gemmatimonas sp. SG8_38_2]
MRYLIGFVLALALVASPLSVSAQDAEEGTAPEPSAGESAPPSEPAPEEPSLQLQLDDAGVQVASPAPRTPDGYTLEEMEHRVKRAKIGLGVSGGIYAVGMGLSFGGLACADNAPSDEFINIVPGRCYALLGTGSVLGLGGLVGMIVSGVRLARHKRDRNWLRRAQYGQLHHIQWDLAQSRFLF